MFWELGGVWCWSLGRLRLKRVEGEVFGARAFSSLGLEVLGFLGFWRLGPGGWVLGVRVQFIYPVCWGLGFCRVVYLQLLDGLQDVSLGLPMGSIVVLFGDYPIGS